MQSILEINTSKPSDTQTGSPPVTAQREQVPTAVTSDTTRMRPGWIAIVLLAVTMMAYSAVGSFGFVNFDDPDYVYRNLQVAQGLTWSGVQWAFTTGHASNWHPLTWISHMLDVQVFGLHPGAHHVINLLLHLANTLLLFGVLQRSTGATGRSALVAALFAVHPLHVESVVWIAERKDVLSTLFFMLTLWAYVSYTRSPALRRYLAVFVLLALGLMAKPMLVTLPFVLLLLDLWPLKRVGVDAWDRATATRLVVEKIPLFALVAISSIVTFLVQREGGAVINLEGISLALRLSNALLSYIAYIGNMVWPSGLAILYPYPGSIPMWKSAAALALLLAASAAAIMAVRRRPYVTVGWFWYVGTLVPVIGIVQVGTQAMADRYTYIPLIGLFLLIAWGGYDLLGRESSRRVPLGVLCVLMVALLGVVTWNQSWYWTDAKTLWARTMAVTTENFQAHGLYGVMLAMEGLKSEAAVHFAEAVNIQPAEPELHTLLGAALADLGRVDEAINHYRESLRLRPGFAPTHNSLGDALAAKGLLAEAVSHYQQALRTNPNDPLVYNRLGVALANLGRPEEAIAYYRATLRLVPDFAPTHYNLGNALAAKGLTAEAISHFEQALQLSPNHPRARNGLGSALDDMGRADEAIAEYRKALKVDPEYAAAHNNLATAYARKGWIDEAVAEMRSALQYEAANAEYHYNFAMLISHQGDIMQARRHLETALSLNPQFQDARQALASLAGGSLEEGENP